MSHLGGVLLVEHIEHWAEVKLNASSFPFSGGMLHLRSDVCHKDTQQHFILALDTMSSILLTPFVQNYIIIMQYYNRCINIAFYIVYYYPLQSTTDQSLELINIITFLLWLWSLLQPCIHRLNNIYKCTRNSSFYLHNYHITGNTHHISLLKHQLAPD